MDKAKIDNDKNKRIRIDDKRFRFPSRVTIPCEGCGEKLSVDFKDEYLVCPIINDRSEVTTECRKCGRAAKIGVKLRVALELAR
jgi:RNase P subunit RPR2